MKKIIEFPTVTQSCVYFGRINHMYNFMPVEVLLLKALNAGEYGESIINNYIELAPVEKELENIDEEELIWEDEFGYTEYTYNNIRYFRYKHTEGDNPNDIMALYNHIDKELYKRLCKLVDTTRAGFIAIDCAFNPAFTDGSKLLENNGLGVSNIASIELLDGKVEAVESTANYYINNIDKTVVITHDMEVGEEEPRNMTL